jgi:hypothetical protein
MALLDYLASNPSTLTPEQEINSFVVPADAVGFDIGKKKEKMR